MRARIPAVLIAFTLTAPLFAQSNEVGVFVNHSSFSTGSGVIPGTPFVIKAHPEDGYGISFTRFLSRRTAIQLSGQKIRGKSGYISTFSGGHFVFPARLGLKEYDAALHWYSTPRGLVRPYVGAGVALIRSGLLDFSNGPGSVGAPVPLQNKVTWLADAGIDVRISERTAVTLAAKYMHYSSAIGFSPSDPSHQYQFSPLTLDGGLQFRF